MNAPIIIRCEDPAALAARAADLVVRSAHEAIRARGRFLLVLSGGSTPEKTYMLLTGPELITAIDWDKTYLFFGDERFVTPEDTQSNFAMAARTLLSRAPVPSSQVFPVPTKTKTKSAVEAAAAYATQLAGFFPEATVASPPRFDLILLGLGDDGHTASLFPGAPALQVADRWVTSSPPGILPPPVDRITMTYPILNAAREVAFLVAGEKKAPAVHDVLEGHLPREKRPAAGVQPVDGSLIWLLDKAAAGLLHRKV